MTELTLDIMLTKIEELKTLGTQEYPLLIKRIRCSYPDMQKLKDVGVTDNYILIEPSLYIPQHILVLEYYNNSEIRVVTLEKNEKSN